MATRPNALFKQGIIKARQARRALQVAILDLSTYEGPKPTFLLFLILRQF